MISIKDHIIGCPQSHYYYYDFADYNGRCGDFYFIEAPINFDKLGHAWFKGKKVVYLELEEPNRFFLLDWFNHLSYDGYFHKVFSICPYTCDWLNKKYKRQHRTHTFIPLNGNIFPPERPKIYDVVYAGHVFPGEITRMIDAMRRFNYRLVSNSQDPRVTDHGVSNAQKLEIMARSRITLVHNLLFLTDFHLKNIEAIGDIGHNQAFRLARQQKIVPQIKGRTFEAAFCKSLILCRRDPFNVIERYFTPGEEFIYYDEGGLADTIADVLANYDRYLPIVERAYRRAVGEYTTRRFFEKFLRDLT